MSVSIPGTRSRNSVLSLLAELAAGCEDEPVRTAGCGTHLCCLASRRIGLASFLPGYDPDHADLPRPGVSARELALQLPGAQSTAQATLSLAALNSLLPEPDTVSDCKGQDLIISHGSGKRVVVVGHFPFVDRFRDSFAHFHVLERNPRGHDVAEADGDALLARADLAAITSTTLMNGSLQRILSLLPRSCFTMLLGPSTPLSPMLFDLGIDALAGSLSLDNGVLLSGVEQGLPFRRLEGIRQVIILANENR